MPKTKSITIYYDPKIADLGAMIQRLREEGGPQFQGRSDSEIAGMLLLACLEQEIAKLPAPSSSQALRSGL